MRASRLATLSVLCLLQTIASPASGQPAKDRAAVHFQQGEELFRQGKYREAREAFSRANDLAPHAVTLYSVALCHENLHQLREALAAYEQALALGADDARRQQITQRMQRLRELHVKVFVSSLPPGAEVTVDSRAAPEPGKTPMVLQLTPGAHMLLLRLDGHLMAARRVEPEVATDTAVQVELTPAPRCQETRCPSCPTCPPRVEPAPSLPDKAVRVDLSPMVGFGLVKAHPFALGGGLRGLVSMRNILVGATAEFFGTNKQDIVPVVAGDVKYSESNQIWLLVQAQGGYLLPVGPLHLTGLVGLGVFCQFSSIEGQKTSDGTSSNTDTQGVGFAWSLGLGLEAMAAPWLSLGVTARAGMIHGTLPDKGDPTKEGDSAHYFITTAAVATFHL